VAQAPGWIVPASALDATADAEEPDYRRSSSRAAATARIPSRSGSTRAWASHPAREPSSMFAAG